MENWFFILKAPSPTFRQTVGDIATSVIPKFAQKKMNPNYSAEIEKIANKVADLYDELADAALWDKGVPNQKDNDWNKQYAEKLRTLKPSSIKMMLHGVYPNKPNWKENMEATLKWKDSEYKNKRLSIFKQIENEVKTMEWD